LISTQIPYIYDGTEVPNPSFYDKAPALLPARFKKRIQNKFDYRCTKDFDARATLGYAPGVGTAFWKNNPDGTLCEIKIHEQILNTVSSFGRGGAVHSGVGTPANERDFMNQVTKPGLYGVRTCEHEGFHEMLTTWDIQRFMQTDPKAGGYGSADANRLEDARIEDLGRQKRPGKPWLNRNGGEYTVPLKGSGGTYGIRKFDWWMWTALNITSPRAMLMSFITAEQIKPIMDKLIETFEFVHSKNTSHVGNPDIDPTWMTPHGKHTGWKDIWRFYKMATNARVIKTSHDLHPILCQFNEWYPAREEEKGGGGGDGKCGGRFGDIEAKAKEMGIEVHNGKSSEPEPEQPKEGSSTEEVQVHDSQGEKESTASHVFDMSEHVSEAELEPCVEQTADPRGDYENDGKTYPKTYFKRIVNATTIKAHFNMSATRKLLDI
jgi:hypothetical protein